MASKEEIEFLIRLRAEGMAQAARVGEELEKLGATAEGVGNKAKKARDEFGRFLPGGGGAGGGGGGGAGGGIPRITDDFDHLGKTVDAVTRRVAEFAAGFMALSMVERMLSGAVRAAREFSKVTAETSTLIAGTTREMSALNEAAREMATTFGTSYSEQMAGMREALSAGATSVEHAIELMEVANKMAIGGSTSQVAAMDVLTSSVNAYAASGLTAAEASDALFVGIALGKMTADELTTSLGQIIPVSSQLGISFEETVAAVAALTTQGIRTSSAVSGVRQAMISIIRPTADAQKMAKSLGLEFDATALRTKGFKGVIDDVLAATGGDQGLIAKLFTDVDGLLAVMSMAGGGGQQFAVAMEMMADGAGATDVAFRKMSESLDQRLNVAFAKMGGVLTDTGTTMLNAFVPALEVAAGTTELLADNFDILAPILIGLTATALPGVVAGLASMVRGTALATTAARALGVAWAVAGGPIGITLGVLAAAASAFVLFRDEVQGVEDVIAELEGTSRELADANTRIADGYRDLAEAKDDLTRATREGSLIEQQAAALAVGNIQEQINMNETLQRQLMARRQNELIELEAAAERQQKEYRDILSGAYTTVQLDEHDPMEAARRMGALFDRTAGNPELLAKAQEAYLTKYIEQLVLAGTPLPQHLKDMIAANEELARAQQAAEVARQSLQRMGQATEGASEAAAEHAALLAATGQAGEDMGAVLDEIYKDHDKRTRDLMQLEAQRMVVEQEHTAAREAGDHQRAATAERAMQSLDEQIEKTTDAKTRVEEMERQLAAMEAASEAFGFDENGMVRSTIAILREALQNAQRDLQNLDNTKLNNLEASIRSVGALAQSSFPEAFGRVGDWLGRQFGGLGDAFTDVVEGYANLSEAAEKGILELIAQAEGTIGKPQSRGYNETLGHGRWTKGMPGAGPGGEMILTNKTLTEILAIGRAMRTPENRAFYGGGGSSALGKYQIVGQTLGGLIKDLGLDPDITLFDEKTQDRLAMELIRQQGGQASKLYGVWEGFKLPNHIPESIIRRGLEVTASGGGLPPVDAGVASDRAEAAREAEREQERRDKDAQREAERKQKEVEQIGRTIAALEREDKAREEMAAKGYTEERINRELAVMRLREEAAEKDIALTEEQTAALDRYVEVQNKVQALGPAFVRAIGEAQAQIANADQTAQDVLGSMLGGFDSTIDTILQKGFEITSLREIWSSTFLQMGSALVKFAFQAMVLQPILERMKNSLADVGSGGGGGGGFFGFLASTVGQFFGLGGRSSTNQHAKGAIYDQSINMPVARLGEAGAEAIMPLVRSSDGTLSVRVIGDGGGGYAGPTRDDFFAFAERFERAVEGASLAGVAEAPLEAYGGSTGRSGPASPYPAAGAPITIAPQVNVTMQGGGAPGAQGVPAMNEEQAMMFSGALEAFITSKVAEFITDQSRSGGMLNPAPTY